MPLILHPSSHCDVCLDNWNPPEKPPFVISCGHIFCERCLHCLEMRICPLCRKSFNIERIKRLHVDLPDAGDLSHDPALQLLQRLALVSKGDSSLEEELIEVVEEAKNFLSWHEESNPACQPLRAAVEALDRFSAMREELHQQDLLHKEERRTLKHKLRNARADVHALEDAEQRLLDDLYRVKHDYQTISQQRHEAFVELSRLRQEAATYRNGANTLPPPPEPVPFGVIPPLIPNSDIPPHHVSSHTSNSGEGSRNHRHRDSQGQSTSDDRARTSRPRKEKSSRRHATPQEYSGGDPTYFHRTDDVGPIPGPSGVSHENSEPISETARGRRREADGWTYSHGSRTPLNSSVNGRKTRDGQGEQPLHFYPGYLEGIRPEQYVSSYAPDYQGQYRLSPRSQVRAIWAETRSQSDNLREEAHGLGLEGVPNVQSGSVMSRSDLFQLRGSSSNSNSRGSNHDDPSSTHISRRPAHTRSYSIGDVTGSSNHPLQTATERRDSRRDRSNTSPPSIPSDVVPHASSARPSRLRHGSPDTSGESNDVSARRNSQMRADTLDGDASRTSNRRSQLGDGPLLPPQIIRSAEGASSSLEPSLTRTSSSENRHQDHTWPLAAVVQTAIHASGVNREDPAHRAPPASQGVLDHNPRQQSEPTDPVIGPSPNALSLMLGPAAASRSAREAPEDSEGARIHAPAPRGTQNPLHEWRIGN